ncbi:MAG: co-chaperone GroES [Candidatus Paceibacterota bacterium]|jgi:chaperonin GroES
MKITPLSDYVLIEPQDQDIKTESGIFLPDTADKEKPEMGKIIAVGSGKKSPEGKIIPVSVKTGDVVFFTKYGPTEIEVDKKKYLIAREDDILAIIER